MIFLYFIYVYIYIVPDLSGTSELPAGSQSTTESKHMYCCVN